MTKSLPKNKSVCLSVVTKYPHGGNSKTRIASETDQSTASKLSEAFLCDFIQNFSKSSLGLDLQLWITPSTPTTKDYYQEICRRFNVNAELFAQPDITFFERLSFIVFKAKSAGIDWVLMTGSDIPDFPFEQYSEVRFEENHVYIGPDSDQGFYFIALESKNFDLLNLFVPESQTVLDSLVKKCKDGGIQVKLLKEWSDIDTIEDLKVSLARNSANELPYTYNASQNLFNS
ncbi:MAG: hypothetical protein GY909_13805 [Oligoflexia bacterium]|nr:hypothetical protein [Oligoflexia bacterium]